MPTQFAALAQASVTQLRDTLRRRAAPPPVQPAQERNAQEFLAGVEVSDSTWSDWQETHFDVRNIHA